MDKILNAEILLIQNYQYVVLNKDKSEFNIIRLNRDNPITWTVTFTKSQNNITTCDCTNISKKKHPCWHLCTSLCFVNLDVSEIYSVQRKIVFWDTKPATKLVVEISSFVLNLCPKIIRWFITISGRQK